MLVSPQLPACAAVLMVDGDPDEALVARCLGGDTSAFEPIVQRYQRVLFNAVQSLRIASILLKPFIPRAAEAIYTSFNFPTPWAEVKYADAAVLAAQPDDLRVVAELVDGKVKPLFPRIG